MTQIILHTRKWEHTNEPDAPKVLLIHGLAASSLTWKLLAKDLYDKGFNVYAPDLLGHGRSPRTKIYSIKEWADSIINLNIQPDLIVGHSIGGLIASRIQETLKAPHLVLVDPVFRLPRRSLILTSVQYFFLHSIVFQTVIQHQVGVKRSKVMKQLKSEWVRFLLWDRSSIKGLVAEPKTIVNRILTGTENILILRAHNSYIVPKIFTTKQFRENVKVVNIKGGHNFFGTNHKDFVNELLTFLEGKLNARKIISATDTLQTVS